MYQPPSLEAQLDYMKELLHEAQPEKAKIARFILNRLHEQERAGLDPPALVDWLRTYADALASESRRRIRRSEPTGMGAHHLLHFASSIYSTLEGWRIIGTSLTDRIDTGVRLLDDTFPGWWQCMGNGLTATSVFVTIARCLGLDIFQLENKLGVTGDHLGYHSLWLIRHGFITEPDTTSEAYKRSQAELAPHWWKVIEARRQNALSPEHSH